MSVDEIPHGYKGHRPPYSCRCDVCRAAWNAYVKEKREERKLKRPRADELSRKRASKTEVIRRAVKRVAAEEKRRAAESSDSVGPMQAAVLAEVEAMTDPVSATALVAAKSLASVIDKLNNNTEGAGAAVINSTTKQLMAIMAEMRGDTTKLKATGRRKSGGRLATVGAMTKVKRQGA